MLVVSSNFMQKRHVSRGGKADSNTKSPFNPFKPEHDLTWFDSTTRIQVDLNLKQLESKRLIKKYPNLNWFFLKKKKQLEHEFTKTQMPNPNDLNLKRLEPKMIRTQSETKFLPTRNDLTQIQLLPPNCHLYIWGKTATHWWPTVPTKVYNK